MADTIRPSCLRCGSLELTSIRGKLGGGKPRVKCESCGQEFDADKSVPMLTEEKPSIDLAEKLREAELRISDLEVLLCCLLDNANSLPHDMTEKEIERSLIRMRQWVKMKRAGQ